MDAEHQYVSLLIALDAALLLILAGLAKKQLVWKRPAPQPITKRRPGTLGRGSLRSVPRWMQVVLILGICAGGVVASGAGLPGAVAPTAAAAYVAAAAFVLFATR